MASTSLSGLVSGIDTSALVTQLVAVEKLPITRLQAARTAKQKTGQTLQALTDKLRNVQKLSKTLSDSANVNATSATVSDDKTVRATTNGSATPGAYAISVTQLASAQRTYSDPVTAKDQTGLFGAGTLSITVGSASAVDVSVTASDTLQSVADKIAKISGVTAGVVYDGSSYRLQVAGAATGAANAVSFTESGTTLGLATPANTVVPARDAIATIDGFSVHSATNTLEGFVTGVSFELTGLSGTTPTSVTVSTDTAAMKTKIKDLVTAINDVNKDIKAFSASQKNPDASVSSISTRLRSVLGSGADGAPETLATLAQIGVTTARDGTLTIDDTKLDKMLKADAMGVARLFAKSETTTGVASKLDAALDAFVRTNDGTLVMKKNSVDATVAQMDKDVTRMTDRLDAYETRIRKQFTAMEQSLAKLNQASSTIVSQG